MEREARDHRTLVVFVKQPTPGRVKTRLVPALGAEAAAALYRVLVEHVLRATSPARGEYERLVFFDPRHAAEAMRRWLVGVQLRHQSGEGLGARLADAFERAFRRGADRVAVVGSDTPSLGRADVTSAFAALDAADVVLGPAEDGGYYLVALRAPQPALFEGIAWSTSGVLAQTLERAAAAGLRVARLATRRDVDTLEDLRAEWALVEPLLGAEPGLRAAVAGALSSTPPAKMPPFAQQEDR